MKIEMSTAILCSMFKEKSFNLFYLINVKNTASSRLKTKTKILDGHLCECQWNSIYHIQ